MFSEQRSGSEEQRGSALVMVLLLAMVVSAIGGTMLFMSNSDHRISGNELDTERALYAARGGVSYGFHLFKQGAIVPTVAGTAFDSFAAPVAASLDGGEFTGTLFDVSAENDQGQLFRLEVTGRFDKASRRVELLFQVVPDAFGFGYMAFNRAILQRVNVAPADFYIESTIFSNGDFSIPDDLTLDGSVVAAGNVTVGTNATISRDVFANAVNNGGTIGGQVRLLSSVREIPASSGSWDVLDDGGTKYLWYDGNSSPGSLSGNAPGAGSSSYTVVDYDPFNYEIANLNGALLPPANINVTKYVPPPKLDYAEMKAEADKNDPTYFTSEVALINYLISKRVNETVAGRAVRTIKVGTPDAPEFIYVDANVYLKLGGIDNPGAGQIAADSIEIEGGIYSTGGFSFDGPNMITGGVSPPYPGHPDYDALKINALPYCYPALVAYNEPASGSLATWTSDDTPAIGPGARIEFEANNNEGPVYINGVMFSQDRIHLHHAKAARELLRINGAELGWDLLNCDQIFFTYDPRVRCTRFLPVESGPTEIVAYREIR